MQRRHRTVSVCATSRLSQSSDNSTPSRVSFRRRESSMDIWSVNSLKLSSHTTIRTLPYDTSAGRHVAFTTPFSSTSYSLQNLCSYVHIRNGSTPPWLTPLKASLYGVGPGPLGPYTAPPPAPRPIPPPASEYTPSPIAAPFPTTPGSMFPAAGYPASRLDGTEPG